MYITLLQIGAMSNDGFLAPSTNAATSTSTLTPTQEGPIEAERKKKKRNKVYIYFAFFLGFVSRHGFSVRYVTYICMVFQVSSLFLVSIYGQLSPWWHSHYLTCVLSPIYSPGQPKNHPLIPPPMQKHHSSQNEREPRCCTLTDLTVRDGIGNGMVVL